MSIFRNIGQEISNILTPAGNAISQIATTSGLAVGAAQNITNAVNANAASFNVSNISNVITDPNVTSLLKVFGAVTPPAGGPPYENVLEQFASYSPLWTLCCLTPEQFNTPNLYRGSPYLLDQIVLSSAGRFDFSRTNTQYGAPE